MAPSAPLNFAGCGFRNRLKGLRAARNKGGKMPILFLAVEERVKNPAQGR